ncbi:glycerophosphodiester phosphodiesterase family protein [Microbacterium sp. RD1]|uniref:glycerophosphodiester phosphodiesterase family protein n=1 Tax=Microbacterium sp. RD1 TaxID=3457313 RepID=UPI003FA5291F
MTHPYFAGSPSPRVLAHRGLVTSDAAAQGVADNSFAAVAAAHAAGATFVESDCHVTRDGVVILFHDDDLSRIAGDPRTVAELTERQLSDIMADHGGLITLEQALDAFPDVRFNLDVKAAGAEQAVGRLVAPAADRVLLTSFSDTRRLAALAAAERSRPDLRPATSAGSGVLARLLAALTLRNRRAVARLLTEVDALQIPERHRGVRILSPRLIDAAHDAGVEVHVWTVNERPDMLRLLDRGVDGLVTDRADLALSLVN